VENTLCKEWFDVLSTVAQSKESLSAEQLHNSTGLDEKHLKMVLSELIGSGYLSDGSITQKGLELLEPYRAKRAILIAAGMGTRLKPITINTPKPLVRVNGKRMIDGLIDACLDAGIDEIHIVRGYLGEQFDQLLIKYPMLQFIDNPIYREANTISSVMAAKHLLPGTYLMSADYVVTNPNIIKKYHYTSDCLAFITEKSDDMCLFTENGIIVDEKIGGENCWQMVCIFYWNEAEGRMLAEDLSFAYSQPGGTKIFWSPVALVQNKGKYSVRIQECQKQDVCEIDTFAELKAIDQSYDCL